MKRVLVGTLIVALSLSMILVLHDQQEMRDRMTLTELQTTVLVETVERDSYQRDVQLAQEWAKQGVRIDELEAGPDYSGVLDALRQTVTLEYARGGHASGVILRDGLVLTAKHCVSSSGYMYPTVKTYTGDVFIVESVYTSNRDDLALLVVPGITGSCELAEPVAEIFDPVFVLGTPADVRWEKSIGFGMIVGFDFSIEGYWIDAWRYNAGTGKGNSGGPVVTPEGKIIGIHVGGPCVRVHTHGVMEPITHILELLEEYERSREANP